MKTVSRTLERLTALEKGRAKLTQEVRELREDFEGFREDFRGARGDHRGLREEVRGLRDELQGVQSETRGLRDDVPDGFERLGRGVDEKLVPMRQFVERAESLADVRPQVEDPQRRVAALESRE